MRLAEEQKLRKEMSAKKAKEEAERKHQVSWGCADSLDIHSLVQQPSANTGCPAPVHATFLRALGACSVPGQARGLWLQGERVQALSCVVTG